MRCVAIALFAVTTAACGQDGPSPEADSLADDVARLGALMVDDLELESMNEVREFIRDDLPVRASELLEAGTIPAARRHQRAVAEESMTSARGQRLRDEGAALLQARVDSLEQYRQALSRGLMEDFTLLEAIQSQRAAEDAILEFIGRLEGLREEPAE